MIQETPKMQWQSSSSVQMVAAAAAVGMAWSSRSQVQGHISWGMWWVLKVFKGQSWDGYWCWGSVGHGWAQSSGSPALPPAGCMSSDLLQWCGWLWDYCHRLPAQKSVRTQRWPCGSEWWELLPLELTGWMWELAAWHSARHSHYSPGLSFGVLSPSPCLCWCDLQVDISS